jgi:hypothetical protein
LTAIGSSPPFRAGAPPRYAEYLATTTDQPSPDGTNQRVLGGENVARVADLTGAVGYRAGYPWVRALVELGDARSLVTVALRKDSTLLRSPSTAGNSVRRLAEALQQQGHGVSRTLVAELLNAAGDSLQGNRKTKEGDSHPTGMRNSPTSTPKWPPLGRTATGDLGRHQEKGADRRFSQQWPRISPPRSSGRSPAP